MTVTKRKPSNRAEPRPKTRTRTKITLTPEQVAKLNSEIQGNAPVLLLVNEIDVDDKYQRPYAPGHPINKKGPKSHLFSAIHVSRVKGGRYRAWEGQHRVALAKACGITHLWVFVDDATTKEQATNFVEMQQGRKGLKKWEVFKAQLIARDPQALAIERALEEGCDRKIGHNPNTDVKAVQAVEDVYTAYGAEVLTHTANAIQHIWPDDNSAWVGEMWAGMALLLSTQGLTARQVANLSRRLPTLIVQEAKAEKAKHTTAGTTGGPAKGSGPYMKTVLLEWARKRNK